MWEKRGQPGLNRWPLDLQSNALPLSYAPLTWLMDSIIMFSLLNRTKWLFLLSLEENSTFVNRLVLYVVDRFLMRRKINVAGFLSWTKNLIYSLSMNQSLSQYQCYITSEGKNSTGSLVVEFLIACPARASCFYFTFFYFVVKRVTSCSFLSWSPIADALSRESRSPGLKSL